MSSAMTPDPVGKQVPAEREDLRRKVERLRAHRSRPVAGAIEMALSSGTLRRSLRRLAMATSVGDNTIRDRMRGASTPTWDAIKRLVADLHSDGRLSDPPEWLQTGRAYLRSLVARPAILPSVLRPGRSWVLLALVSCAAGLPLHGGNAEELAVADLGLEPLLFSCAAGLPLHHDDRVSGEVRVAGGVPPCHKGDRGGFKGT